MDITDVILNDHHEQRRMFALLDQMHDAAAADLHAVWSRLRILLEVHAKAEELLFYPELLDLGKKAGKEALAGDETEDAIHDHNEIRDAIADVGKHAPGSGPWWQAVAQVNKVNGDHMAEEEREGLSDFRRSATLELRHSIALAFCVFEAAHASGIDGGDVDPKSYLRRHQ
ncbi:hemerythrin domain-containing protein [bacterium RCC_150]